MKAKHMLQTYPYKKREKRKKNQNTLTIGGDSFPDGISMIGIITVCKVYPFKINILLR